MKYSVIHIINAITTKYNRYKCDRCKWNKYNWINITNTNATNTNTNTNAKNKIITIKIQM